MSAILPTIVYRTLAQMLFMPGQKCSRLPLLGQGEARPPRHLLPWQVPYLQVALVL